jgi:hypothetical protein
VRGGRLAASLRTRRTDSRIFRQLPGSAQGTAAVIVSVANCIQHSLQTVFTCCPFLITCSILTLQGDRDLDSNARVLALQLAVQQITLNVVPQPMHAGEEQGCFALTLQQTRVQAAVEDGVTDIRQVVW